MNSIKKELEKMKCLSKIIAHQDIIKHLHQQLFYYSNSTDVAKLLRGKPYRHSGVFTIENLN
jgi:hypothetical protein